MTTQRTRPVTASAMWFLFGLVALVVVSACVAVGAASLRTADRTAELLVQLQDANSQIDHLRADYSAAQDAQLRLEQQNERLIRVNRQQRAQLRALLAYLREHGISVPRASRTSYEPEPTTAPKGPAANSGTPRPSTSPSPSSPSPATPAPTGTTPQPTPTPAPTPADPCHLAPALCALIRR
jgi:hypothetical protein